MNYEIPASSARPHSDECWVFKIGGSLLNRADLAERVRGVVRQVSTKPLLIVGGGTTADEVRRWENVHHLDSSTTHWLAIRAMTLNEHLIKALLPETVRISCLEEADRVWERNGMALLDVFEWIQREEGARASLPHSWEVTSDSIAAYIALRWRAKGLVLLKSIDAPASLSAHDETGEAVLDEYFSHLAPQLPQIAWCNLQAAPWNVITCHPPEGQRE